MALTPLLSEYDPLADKEGPLDPLGFYGIANALGVRLIPGIRERQSNPRFLTLIAVGSVIASRFDEDDLIDLPESRPWLVYEWHVVEGLVRAYNDGPEVLGLAGRLKAARALAQGTHLGKNNYLKTPSVFGLHGIYRLLAHDLDVLDRDSDSRLSDFGHDLVEAWEKDQGLQGFSRQSGEGAKFRDQLYQAVIEGMQLGCVKRGGGWDGWRFIMQHLSPHAFGPLERELIQNALVSTQSDFRRQAIEYLISPKGQALWTSCDGSERDFHQALLHHASSELCIVLEAIEAYERFSRLAQDAFDDCLYHMTRRNGKVSPKELARLESVKKAAISIPSIYAEVSDKLQAVDMAIRFNEAFQSLGECADAETWVERMLEHHRKTQRVKPPQGKMPWIERFEDGQFMIRPAYRRSQGGRGDEEYVNFYRTHSLWSFAKELGWVSNGTEKTTA